MFEPPLILHVIHHLVIGGMENGLINLINKLPVTEFRHLVACVENFSDFRDRINRDDVSVYSMQRSVKGVFSVRRQVYELCRRFRPTIIHTRNLSGLDALLPARLAGVGICIHGEHGWDVDDLNGDNRKRILLKRVHRPIVNKYVAVSKHIETYLRCRIGVPQRKVKLIYNGVDTDRFSPIRRRSEVFPADFRPADRVIIGTVGRVQAVKDQATLIRAFANLISSHPGDVGQARLVIIGGGPLLGEIRQLISDLGISHLCWVPGSIHNVAEIMRGLDIFVLTSFAEGLSNTILEAMSSGIPVIATRVGGNVELVRDSVSGHLIDVQDRDTLVRHLFRYISDCSLRASHGASGRKLAVANFSIDAMVQNYRDLYNSFTSPAVTTSEFHR